MKRSIIKPKPQKFTFLHVMEHNYTSTINTITPCCDDDDDDVDDDDDDDDDDDNDNNDDDDVT